MTKKFSADVLVIGGGISGLVAASKLEASGKSVIVLDKGRSVGGRLATRRIGNGRADHGAQFFTVRTETFKAYVDQWIADNVVYMWSLGFSDGSLAAVGDDGHPRYAVYQGMNNLPKHLASQLKDVRTNVLVTDVQRQMESWVVHDSEKREYLAKVVIMTTPVPQALEVLKKGGIQLDPQDKAELESIEYLPCLTGMFHIGGNVRLPSPGAVQRRHSPISWISNNKQKGISDETIITVQADGNYSQQLWNATDERIINALLTDLRVYLPENAEILETQLKRWRYSFVLKPHPDRFLAAKNLPLLIFGGDAFGGPRIEGAVLSGDACAEAVLTGVLP